MAFIAFMGDDLEGRLDLKRIYFDCSSMLGLSLEERDNYSGSFLHKYFEMNYLLENADYTGFEIDGKIYLIDCGPKDFKPVLNRFDYDIYKFSLREHPSGYATICVLDEEIDNYPVILAGVKRGYNEMLDYMSRR